MAVEAESPFPSGITTDSAVITLDTTVVMVAIEAATVADMAAMVMVAGMDTAADMHPFMATRPSTRFTRPLSITADVTVTERQACPEAVSKVGRKRV